MLRPLRTVCCALLVVAVGCMESYKPGVSTETGNPPVIDSDKIALVVTRDEVHVQGEPGAVTPPEGEIEVKILRNQELVRGPIADDGSFDVEVDATLDDVFEVRAVNGDQRSMAVIVVRGGAMVGEGDGGVLTCEQKSDIAYDTVTQAIANADRRCETAADCMIASPDSACFAGCGFDYRSAEGIASIEAVREALDDGFCADYEDGCDRVVPPCVPPEAAECHAGECYAAGEYMGPVDGGVSGGCDLDIELCFATELTWRTPSAGILPALPSPAPFALTGCDTLETYANNGVPCAATVPQCVVPSSRPSVSSIRAALANPDVVAAFEAGGTFGETEERSGLVYELTLGDSTITYRSCAGASAGVVCEPSALETLIDLLGELAATSVCDDPQPIDCTSDFEAGDCDAAIPVYWHDPRTGACVPDIYGGCGGNRNRYASLNACQAACAPPSAQSDCEPGHTLDTTCFECPMTNCTDPQTTCSLQCEVDQDCASLASPTGAVDYVCNAADNLCMPLLGCP